ARSVADTENVCGPSVEVSSSCPLVPSPAEPTHVARPDCSSWHLKTALKTLFCLMGDRSPGCAIRISGLTASTLNVRVCASSTRPRLSVARNWTERFPFLKPEIGVVYVDQPGAPSSEYSILAIPEPPLVAESVSVGDAYHPFWSGGSRVAVVT